MYKFLLCMRYLKTRWIALASIVSVTLGVATLIVVNSVMDGFTTTMQDRMHGILSDIVLETRSQTGITQPQGYEERIRARLGDRVAGVTTVVTLPAMMTFQRNGNSHTQQINLIGIDQNTFASVSDFSKYLLHPENKKQLDFLLKNNGYAVERERMQPSGWEYRAPMARYQKVVQQRLRNAQELEQERFEQLQQKIQEETQASDGAQADPVAALMAGPGIQIANNAQQISQFDSEKEQRTGIVLGINLGSIRGREPDGTATLRHPSDGRYVPA